MPEPNSAAAPGPHLLTDDVILTLAEHLDVPDLGVAAAVCCNWAGLLRPAIKHRIKALKDPRDLSLELEATRSLSPSGEVSWRALALVHALDAEIEAAWSTGRPTVRWVPVLNERCAAWISTAVDPYTGTTVVTPSTMNGPDCWSRPLKPYTPPTGYESYYAPHEDDQHDDAHGGDELPLCSFTIDSKLQYHRVDPLPRHMAYAKPVRGMGPIAFCIYPPEVDKGDADGGHASEADADGAEVDEDGANEDGADEVNSNAHNSAEADADEGDPNADDADENDADEDEDDVGTCELIVWVTACDWRRFWDGEPYEDPQYHGLCRLTSFQASGETSLSASEFTFHLDYDTGGIIRLIAAWCNDGKVYIEELCYAKGRSTEDQRARGDTRKLRLEDAYFDNDIVIDNDYVFAVLGHGEGVAVWRRDTADDGKGIIMVHTDQGRFLDKESWFDVTSNALAKKTTMGEWALGKGPENVPVTPGRARSLMLERVPWEEGEADQFNWNMLYIDSESLAIADRHLVWKGYDYFAVIPHYASLLREIFAGDFSNDDWVGGLVTSHLCRFHFDTHRDSIPSIVRAVDHHLACLMPATTLIIDLDDISGALGDAELAGTVRAVEITRGFSFSHVDQLSITPRGVLQMVRLDEQTIQYEYTEATKDFDPALKCRGGEEARQYAIRMLSFEPHRKFARTSAGVGASGGTVAGS